MRLMIGTPAYGGMLTTRYVQSLYQTFHKLTEHGIQCGLYTIHSESLITRGRNSCAQAAMKHGFDKLMFIDADISWKWSDLEPLLNSDKLVVGGTYPKKSFPMSLNYNVLTVPPGFNNERKSMEDHAMLAKLADPVTSEVEVMHIPTGFMMIDTKVFRMLQPKVQAYTNLEPMGEMEMVSDFFTTQVNQGMYESEDWAFCSLCRANGIPIYLNTNIITDHTGPFTFSVHTPGK